MRTPFKHTLLAMSLAAAITGLTACDDGNDGAMGPQGLTDPQGEQGAQGVAGQDGKDSPRNLTLEVVGRFSANDLDSFDSENNLFGKSAAEIVQFHRASNSAFAVNGAENQIEVISLAELPTEAVVSPMTDHSLTSTEFTFPSSIDVADGSGGIKTLALGDANSIAIHGDLLAIAVAADTKTDKGAILFYTLDNMGQGTLVKGVEAGALPDMVTFTPDGTKALVANEGEPNSDYTIDPEGTLSVIEITGGMPADTASEVNFTSDLIFKNDSLDDATYDVSTEAGIRALLSDAGVKLSPATKGAITTSVAQDLEPEYITVSADSKTAFVALQENNALAIVDLTEMEVQVKALGYKDWGDYELDFTNKDEVPVFMSVENVYGMYQPDTIDSFEWNGATFIVSANEGDARDYDGYSEEERGKDLTIEPGSALEMVYDDAAAALALESKDALGRIKVTTELGDKDGNSEYDSFYTYGARSFSIWDQNGNLIYDSGDDFGKIAASILGDNFNSTHTENKGDNRSDDKGGEPEAIAVGQVGEKTYAFIAQERAGDLFVYDITNPFNTSFVTHYNNRDFEVSFELDDDLDNPCDKSEGMNCDDAPMAGDLGPESIKFVDAEDSPNGNALIIVGNEVSGSVTVYQVTEK